MNPRNNNSTRKVEYDRIEEGVYHKGKWMPGRILNGDERISLLPDNDFKLINIKLLDIK
ncbi:DUF5597 domain-containing protein [Aestuariicella hydrocarbonica]|uniref:DUF5597 domain-containing protein n=1 Tax=Pseudomaricurvus hydrocarbonicus TaxID=1470433 RepID=A0A9E5MND7_9GAMM|nr:DUF5597 domain-containing protein [Aestuariicella hydrocarbonica]